MKQARMTHQGFTLLELLVTATMIAVLTVIGIVSYSSVNKRSRDVKRKSDVEQIRSALEMFRSDNGYYPENGSGNWVNATSLEISAGPALVPTYLPSIPTDPQAQSSPPKAYYYKAENLQALNYYGYCICACLESSPCTTVISNTCNAGDVTANCNYYSKNP